MRRAVIAAALLLPAIGNAAAVCSWDRSGHNPFMGDVVAAVDSYTDIPASTRAKLKARMQRRDYDDIAAIRRDSIKGHHQYAPEITGMHFGQGQVCATVTRARWTAEMVERGLVYCEDGHCILVPTVCRNVSRITRLVAASPAMPPGTAGGGSHEPLDISPSAGTWGVIDAPAPSGAGLRLPMWPMPADPAWVGNSPTLLLSPPPVRDEAGPDGGMPPWADRPLPIDQPGPPLVLSGPTLPAPIPPVPEPAAWASLAAGLLAVLVATRRHSLRSSVWRLTLPISGTQRRERHKTMNDEMTAEVSSPAVGVPPAT